MAHGCVAVVVFIPHALPDRLSDAAGTSGGVLTMGNGIAAANVRLKRAYEPAEESDGMRILVDRLWPRGVSKAQARIDRWMKDVAPSAELRTWFGHDPARWDEFRKRYRTELAGHREAIGELRRLARSGPVTLVYSARDERHNDAIVLRNLLLGRRAAKLAQTRATC